MYIYTFGKELKIIKAYTEKEIFIQSIKNFSILRYKYFFFYYKSDYTAGNIAMRKTKVVFALET